MARPVRFKAVVERVDRHTEDVASYRLCSDRSLPKFVPGQFIHLAIDPFDPSSFWPESRVFSVANSVKDRRTVVLTISRQGDYTSRILSELHEGSYVWGKGPYGEFTIDATRESGRIVAIAGGTGVTPFCAFMEDAIEKGVLPVDEVVLYYGARTQELLIYRDLVEKVESELNGFRVQYFVERLEESHDKNKISGSLDIDFIVTDLGDLSDTSFYISGPKVMISAFQYRLTCEYAVPNDSLFIDAWD